MATLIIFLAVLAILAVCWVIAGWVEEQENPEKIYIVVLCLFFAASFSVLITEK